MTGYTTVWVRPASTDFHYSGPYGTGDGSSYANAISGLMNVTWSTPKLQVIVAGTHLDVWTGDGTVTGHALIPVMAGTNDSPTIIRGDATRFDAAATPGLICGGMIDQYSPAWEPLGDGVWKRTSGLYSFSYKTWSARVVSSETHPSHFPVVTPVETMAECTATENTSFLEFTGNPHTIYIHLPVGIDPSTHYITPDFGYRFDFSDKPNIILNRLQIMFSNIENPVKLECRKSDFWYWPNELVSITGGRYGNIVDRSRISYAKSGVDAASVQTTAPHVSNNIRVTGTHITDIGGTWFTRKGTTAHAITARHGVENFYIDGCKIERAGNSIVMNNQSWSRKCKDVAIKRTVIRSPHEWYNTNNWDAIAFLPTDSFMTEDWVGFITTGNIVERCYINATGMSDGIRNGISLEYDVNDPTIAFRYRYNQIDDGSVAISMSNGTALSPERSSTGNLYGNIMRRQTVSYIEQQGSTATRKNWSRNGGTVSDYNVFVSDGVTPTATVSFGGSNLTLAQWKAESPRFDPNSVNL